MHNKIRKKSIEIEVQMDHFIHLAKIKSVVLYEKKSKKPKKDTPLSAAFWAGYAGTGLEVEKTVFNLMAYRAGQAYALIPTNAEA